MKFLRLVIFVLLSRGVALANSPVHNTSQSDSTLSMADKQLLIDLSKQVEELQGQIQQEKNSKSSSSNKQFSTYSSQVGNSLNTTSHYLDIESSDIRNAMANEIAVNITENSGLETRVNQNSIGDIFSSSGGINTGSGPAITTRGEVTYLGSYFGNNTISIGMIPSNLFASTLLGQRQRFDDYSVFFGGYIEADAQAQFGSNINRTNGLCDFQSNGQNIYLTNSKLYFLSNVGHYVTAQFDFDTNETGDFVLGNAFVMFGNLDTSPFFVTVVRSQSSVRTSGIIDEFFITQ